MKTCPDCRKTKQADCFHKDRSQKDGLFRICKDCRKSKVTTVTPSVTKVTIKPDKQNSVPLFWRLVLTVLFIGGFVLSCFNGSYAFIDTAKTLTSQWIPVVVAVVVVLTLGTAITCYMGVVRGFTPFIFLFAVVQGLNGVVNYTGVKIRLEAEQRRALETAQSKDFSALLKLRETYSNVLSDMPTTVDGRIVSYKQDYTNLRAKAISEIMNIDEAIATARQQSNLTVQFSAQEMILLLAFLLIPELVMFFSILAFRYA